MIILQPVTTPQTINFIARTNAVDSLVIRDEEQNTETTINQVFTYLDPYMTADIIFSLREDKFYSFKAYSCGEIVYRGMIFCTDQDENYSINDGSYKQHSSNNDYITL